MASRLMFSVDLRKCINCKTCEMACNEYYGLTENHRRKIVTYKTSEDVQANLSISCNHCANPVCVSICPENNFQKRYDGIVVLQAKNCLACMRCVSACPFQAPKFNPKTNTVDKCNFCVERIDQGLKPVCVENCVTSALGVIAVNSQEIKKYSLKDADIPMMDYTNPSIYVANKKKGKTFLRER